MRPGLELGPGSGDDSASSRQIAEGLVVVNRGTAVELAGFGTNAAVNSPVTRHFEIGARRVNDSGYRAAATDAHFPGVRLQAIVLERVRIRVLVLDRVKLRIYAGVVKC